MRCRTTRLGLVLVDDAAPQQVADVRSERVDLGAVGVEGEREVLAVFDPEVAVEAALQVGGLLFEPLGVGRVLPDLARQAGAAHLGVVGVALQLAGRPREPRQAAVAVGDRIPGVLPALVLEAGLLVAPLVGDVAVALQVGVVVDPGQGGPGRRLEGAHQPGVAGPALVLVEEHEVQRRWRRQRRSTESGAAPRRRSARRSAARAGCGRGLRRGSRRPATPCHRPSAVSVVAANSELNGSACRLVKMLSRPNMVMNQGRPAAGRCGRAATAARTAAPPGRPGCVGRSRLSGAQSHSRRGASSSHLSRLRSMLGLALWLPPSYLGMATLWPGASDARDHVQVGRPSDRAARGSP